MRSASFQLIVAHKNAGVGGKMYKTKSQSMQRGAQKRDPKPRMTLEDEYRLTKIKLTRAEQDHFAVGATTQSEFLDQIRPLVLGFSKGGIRKPKDIAKALNSCNRFTACAQPWTPRLAWFLLRMIFSRSKKRSKAAAAQKLTAKRQENRAQGRTKMASKPRRVAFAPDELRADPAAAYRNKIGELQLEVSKLELHGSGKGSLHQIARLRKQIARYERYLARRTSGPIPIATS